jgi:hypothetical protein
MNSCQLLKSRIGGSVSAEVSPYNSSGVVRIEAVLVLSTEKLVEFDRTLTQAGMILSRVASDTSPALTVCGSRRIRLNRLNVNILTNDEVRSRCMMLFLLLGLNV